MRNPNISIYLYYSRAESLFKEVLQTIKQVLISSSETDMAEQIMVIFVIISQ